MELSFKDLRKRDVINVADGRCLGKVSNLFLEFPRGILTGIAVPERKNKGLFRCFDKSELYIDQSKILKIGNDVILVDLKCGDVCSPSVRVGKPEPRPPHGGGHRPDRPSPCNPCPPPCNPCAPQCGPQDRSDGGGFPPTCEQLFGGGNSRIDTDDY